MRKFTDKLIHFVPLLFLLALVVFSVTSCFPEKENGRGGIQLHLNTMIGQPTRSGDGKSLICQESDVSSISYFTYTMEALWTPSDYQILGATTTPVRIEYDDLESFTLTGCSQGEWKLTLIPYDADNKPYKPIVKQFFINSFETVPVEIDLNIQGDSGSVSLGDASSSYTFATMDSAANYGSTYRVAYVVTRAGKSVGNATVVDKSSIVFTEGDGGITKGSISDLVIATGLESGVYTVSLYIQEQLDSNWQKNDDGTWTNQLTGESISGYLAKTADDGDDSRWVNAAGNVCTFNSIGAVTVLKGLDSETVSLLTKDCINLGFFAEDSVSGLSCTLDRTNDGFAYTYTCTVTSDAKPTSFVWVVNGVIQTSGITTADDKSSSVYRVTYAQSETTNKSYSVTCAIADATSSVSNTVYTDIKRVPGIHITSQLSLTESKYTRTFTANKDGEDIKATSYLWQVKNSAGTVIYTHADTSSDTFTYEWNRSDSGTYTVVCTATMENGGTRKDETDKYTVGAPLTLDILPNTGVEGEEEYINTFYAGFSISGVTATKYTWYAKDPSDNVISGTRVEGTNRGYECTLKLNNLMTGTYTVWCEATLSDGYVVTGSAELYTISSDWNIRISTGAGELTANTCSNSFVAVNDNRHVAVDSYTWTVKNSSGTTVSIPYEKNGNRITYTWDRSQAGDYTISCTATSGTSNKTADTTFHVLGTWTLSIATDGEPEVAANSCTHTISATPSDDNAGITSYVWYINGVAQNGDTTARILSYTSTSETPYTVKCVASNGVDTIESNTLTITPVFVVPPTVVLDASIESGLTVSYTWTITGEYDTCVLVDASGNKVSGETSSQSGNVVTFQETFTPSNTDITATYQVRVTYATDKKVYSNVKTVKVYRFSVDRNYNSWTDATGTNADYYIYTRKSNTSKDLTITTTCPNFILLGVGRNARNNITVKNDNVGVQASDSTTNVPVSTNTTVAMYTYNEFTDPSNGITVTNYANNSYTSYVAIDKSQLISISEGEGGER